jgi:hypothetical protein
MDIVIGLCSSRFDLEFKKSIKGINKIIIPKNFNVQIVVIDNNFLKDKKKYLKKFKVSRNFEIIYRIEKKRGIVHARNNFLKFIYNSKKKIDYIGFIDDDCVPKTNWLLEHLKTFNKFDCDISTGPQLLKNNNNKNFEKKYQILNRKIVKRYAQVVWAATNNVLLKYKKFNKTKYIFDIFLNDIGGSDQLFFKKLHSDGFIIYWNKKAIVYEIAKPDRFLEKWFKMRSLRYGYSGAYMENVLFGKIRGTFISMIKILVFSMLSLINLFLIFNKKNLYRCNYYFFKIIGKVSYFLGIKLKKYY